MAKAFYTSAEAVEILGVTPPRIRQMVLAGEMPAEKHGRALLILPEAIEQAKLRKTKPGRAVSTATNAADEGALSPAVGKPAKKVGNKASKK